MFEVDGHRNYIEEETKGRGQKFLRLFYDLVCGTFCRPCNTQETTAGTKNSYSLLKAAAFQWQLLIPCPSTLKQ